MKRRRSNEEVAQIILTILLFCIAAATIWIAGYLITNG